MLLKMWIFIIYKKRFKLNLKTLIITIFTIIRYARAKHPVELGKDSLEKKYN